MLTTIFFFFRVRARYLLGGRLSTLLLCANLVRFLVLVLILIIVALLGIVGSLVGSVLGLGLLVLLDVGLFGEDGKRLGPV